MTKFCDKFFDIDLTLSGGLILFILANQNTTGRKINFQKQNGKIYVIKWNNPELLQNWAMQDAKV